MLSDASCTCGSLAGAHRGHGKRNSTNCTQVKAVYTSKIFLAEHSLAAPKGFAGYVHTTADTCKALFMCAAHHTCDRHVQNPSLTPPPTPPPLEVEDCLMHMAGLCHKHTRMS